MLYKYEYIKKHRVHRLNWHLDFFFGKIKKVSPKANFKLELYFHKEFIVILNRSPTLKQKFSTFFSTYKKLDAAKKSELYSKIIKCRGIERFFEDLTIDCKEVRSDQFAKYIKDNSLTDLMGYLAETTLKSPVWNIKDHYKKMYKSMPNHKACPFCGIGTMHQTFQEDYDHLACKKHYPLSATNLKNLAPMCGPCNTKFKKDIDVLYDQSIRRPFAYPYTTVINVEFDYSKSIIPGTDKKTSKGHWKIEIIPNSDINKTWFTVFQIEKRYVMDYVQPKFDIWIDNFLDDIADNNISIPNVTTLKAELKKISKSWKSKRFIESNIIKGPLFDYLADCNNSIFYNSIMRRLGDKITKLKVA